MWYRNAIYLGRDRDGRFVYSHDGVWAGFSIRDPNGPDDLQRETAWMQPDGYANRYGQPKE